MKDHEEKIDCQKCRHFYITWDRNFPNGCKSMSFKSKNIPSIVAYESSGIACQQFQTKDFKRK